MTETETAEARSEGATGSRRKLTEDQEREVTRLYAETETPVSEISKRFGIGECWTVLTSFSRPNVFFIPR